MQKKCNLNSTMILFIIIGFKGDYTLLRDISNWVHVGYGGRSTLEKEELVSPEETSFFIKYPRDVEVGVSWEDITELVAAKIASIMGLESMEVEIVTRNGRRGCLLKNFVVENEPNENEEGGPLIGIMDDYNSILESPLRGYSLIEYGFNFIKQFPYWSTMKDQFIEMQFFDVLIGNQDRHPFNWMLLFFYDGRVRFSPIYDNGASLGFRFTDDKLKEMLTNDVKMNKYIKNTKVKVGIFEHKQVKAKEVLKYIINEFPVETISCLKKIENFDLVRYTDYIKSLNEINEAQREWLLRIIPLRREKILKWIEEEGI